MGKRGPPPKPTELRLVEGVPGHHRPISDREPKPSSEKRCPSAPAWLHREAKREWRRVAPELYQLGLLTRVDRAAFAGYCQLYSRWWEAERELRKLKGLTTDEGKPRPQIRIARESLEAMRRFCTEFGFTPAARTRIEVTERTKPPEVANRGADRFFA